MMRKPKMDGVPDWLLDAWLARLADGDLSPDDQRNLHCVLLHKLSGKPGVPALPGARIKRRFHASVYEGWVRNEIARLKAAGPPPRGGYRAAALETCAERWGWKSGEALEVWLRRAA
jgi:hypothetical protein